MKKVFVRFTLLAICLILHLVTNAQWNWRSYNNETCNGILVRSTNNITIYGDKARLMTNLGSGSFNQVQVGSSSPYPILSSLDAAKDPTSNLNLFVGKGYASGSINLYRAGSSTWQTVVTLPNMQQVEFYNDTIGYVSGLGMKRTINRTQSFTTLTLPASVANIVLNKLITPARNAVFASGDTILIKSFDQGDTWQSDTFPATITALGFLNADTGYLATVGGAMYKTYNGGTDWVLLHQLPIRVYKDIEVLNADTAFVVGDDIYRTIDGGISWQRQLYQTVNAVDIDYVGQLGMAVDSSGKYWYSYTYGGNTGVNANDAGGGLVRLAPGQSLYCPGQYDLICDIRNYGSDTLHSVNLVVNINTTGQTDTIHWTGTILPGDMRQNYYLGNYYLDNDTNIISISTYLPNGAPDADTINDTLQTTFLIRKLIGTYTVGDTSADFLTLNHAFNALYLYKQCGPVVFDVLPGHYRFSNVFLKGTGSNDPNNSVTIRSTTGNPDDVIISDSTINNIYDIITLDNVRYVNFEGITFKSFRSAPNTAIGYIAGAGDVNIKNCRFEVLNTAFGHFGFGPQVSNVVLQGQLSIDSCLFKNNGGIYANVAGLCEVKNSTAIDSRMYFAAADGFTIQHNKLFGACTIDMLGGSSGGNIHHNVIDGGYVYINGAASANADTVFVYNNYINTTQYTNATIELLNGAKAYIANNTLLKSTVGGIIYLRDVTLAPKVWVYNNILQHTGNDRVYDGNVKLGNFDADYNVLMGKDSILNRSSQTGVGAILNYYTLERWQSLLGLDKHSYYHKVKLAPGDYAVQPYQQNILLNGNGTPLPLVIDDVEGNVRDANEPDIGAFELTLPSFDASIAAALPAGQMCVTNQQYFVKVHNLGTTVIDSLSIGWTLNGNLKTSVSFNTPILPGDTSTWLYLGDSTTISGVTYNLVAWLDSVNGTNDMSAVNDTLPHSVLAKGLAGTYTIGGTNPNYSTIQAAISALINNGVCDNVTFTIAPGTYTLTQNPTVFSFIQGADSTRQIVFRSQTLDSTSVIISGQYLTLTGTRYVTFDHVGFDTNIWFEGGASYNTFSNCRFNFQATAALNLRTNAVTQPFSGNRFINNFFLRTIVDWNGSAMLDKDNRFVGNRFVNKNVQIQKQQGLVFIDNVIIDTLTAYTTAYSNLDFRTNYAPITIERNKVHSKNMDGMYVAASIPAALNTTGNMLDAVEYNRINNNSVTTLKGKVGLKVDYGAVYHNTVRLHGYGTAFILSYLGKVKNNIFASHKPSVAAVLGYLTDPLEADYNVYYGGDTVIRYQHVNYNSIFNWFSVSGQDEHSIFRNPTFVDSEGFSINNDFAINNSGTPLPGITIDIEGDLRSTTAPDAGADEFDVVISALDVGIAGNPTNIAFCQNNPTDFQLSITNYGTTAIDSVLIRWQVNGITQTPFTWHGNLAADSSKLVTIGTFTFNQPIAYNIRFWVDKANGQVDNNITNDTLEYSNLWMPLSGDYRVWGVNPDFATINDAFNYIKQYGICGPTNLNVTPGTYNLATITPLTTYAGASASNVLTIKSATGRATDVLFTNVTMEIQGVSHLTVKHISLSQSCALLGAINLRGNCTNLVIDSCDFTCTSFSANNTSYGITNSAAGSFDTLIVSNNTFHGGAYKVQYSAKNVLIEKNLIIDPYDNAIFSDYAEDISISKNLVYQQNPRSNYSGKAFLLRYLKGDISITNNYIEGAFLTGMELANFNTYNQFKVFNNVVNGDTAMTTGIVFTVTGTSFDHDSVIYNTIALRSPITTSVALNFGSNKLKVTRNNILVHLGGGVCVRNMNTNASTSNNVLYSLGQNLYNYRDTLYASFNDVQARGLEQNSVSADPEFVAANDLHFTASALNGAALPIAGILYDIQDTLRNPTAPNPGAYEVIPTTVYDSTTKDLTVTKVENASLVMGNQSFTITVKLNELFSTSNYYQYIGGIDSIFVGYSINDTFIAAEAHAVTLLPGDSISYTFTAPFSIPKGRTYNLKGWATLAAKYNDVVGVNDTAYRTLSLPMAGTYSVYGQYPDFLTIRDAMASLTASNSSNTVIFDMRAGADTTYSNFHIIGSANRDRIIYRSASGNPNDVILRVSDVRDAYNVTLKDITILPQTNTYYMYTGKGLDVYGCSNFEVNGCIVKGDFNRNSNVGFSFVACNGTNISNTHFQDLSTAIGYAAYTHPWLDFQGVHKMDSCTFDNVDYGIWAENDWNGVDSLVITNCQMNVTTIGMRIDGEDHRLIRVVNNKINNLTPGIGILFSGLGTCNNGWVMNNWVENGRIQFNYLSSNTNVYRAIWIANNFVGNGIYINGQSNRNSFPDINLFHNSVFEGLHVNGQASVKGYNNSFAGGSSPAFTFNLDTAFTGSNNNFYRLGTGPLASRSSVPYMDENALYGVHPVLQNVFFSTDPLYVSNTDLHIRPGSGLIDAGIAVTGLPLDIDGDPRNQNMPDVGADEYTTPPAFYDLALLPLITDTMPCANGDVKVRLYNNGTSAATDASILLKLNGSNIDTLVWNGNLQPGDTTAALLLSNISFTGGQQYQLKAYLMDLNSVDAYPHNDTVAEQFNFVYNLLVAPGANNCGDILFGADTTFISYLWSTSETTDSIIISASGTYTLTVTDRYGCTATDAQVINVIPAVTFDVAVTAATCGVADGSIALTMLSGTAPFTYNWYPVLSSTSLMDSAITGLYLVEVEDINGCITDSVILVRNSCQDVWPGDANTDGVVDVSDFVYLCIAEGEVGPVRTNATINWNVEPAQDWTYELGQSNLKHLDTDGNGLIALDDSMAVLQNYGQSHLKTGADNRAVVGAPLVYLDIREISAINGDSIHIDVYAGENSLPLDSVFALTLKVLFNQNHLLPDGPIDIANSWLGSTSELATIQKAFQGEWNIAVSRFQGGNVSGKGILATFAMKVPDNLGVNSPMSFTTRIDLESAQAFNNLAEPIAINWKGDSLTINAHPVSVATIGNDNTISIYPNPVEGVLNVKFSATGHSVITVYDMLGNNVHKMTSQGREATIDCTYWSAGLYILEVESNGNKVQMKLVKNN